MRTLWLCLFLMSTVVLRPQVIAQGQESLDIYYIDVEGGAVVGVSVDGRDHIWVVHRPRGAVAGWQADCCDAVGVPLWGVDAR